jgi:hypothetical protein
MSGYCYCGRPATTTSGSCGHADCNETMTAQVNRALSANPVPPAPPGRLTREQMQALELAVEAGMSLYRVFKTMTLIKVYNFGLEDELDMLDDLKGHVRSVCSKAAKAAALAAEGETPPAPQDGIRHDAESGTYVARHTILTAGTTYAEAAMALASAVHLTAKHWPKSPAPVAGEGETARPEPRPAWSCDLVCPDCQEMDCKCPDQP